MIRNVLPTVRQSVRLEMVSLSLGFICIKVSFTALPEHREVADLPSTIFV